MGRLNKSGKTTDKESYKYYKDLYRATKSYYLKKKHTDMFGDMLSEKDWKLSHDTYNTSNKDLVWDQFHEYNKKITENMYAKLREAGSKISKYDVSQKNISKADWDIIDTTYHQFRFTMSAADAQAAISQMFWGDSQ